MEVERFFSVRMALYGSSANNEMSEKEHYQISSVTIRPDFCFSIIFVKNCDLTNFNK